MWIVPIGKNRHNFSHFFSQNIMNHYFIKFQLNANDISFLCNIGTCMAGFAYLAC